MNTRILSILTALLILLAACNEPTEAPRVELPVVVDAGGLKPVTTDLGYQIEVTEARMAFKNLAFTIAGELHTNETHAQSVWQTLSRALLPTAHAHPGHFGGGEVTGELPGKFVVDFFEDDGQQLGLATLLAGTYRGANFTFSRASEEHLDPDDPLAGHTAIISGTATRNGASTAFTIVLDSHDNRDLIGAPLTRADGTSTGFQAHIDQHSTGSLAIQLLTEDPVELDTIFDGIDFDRLQTNPDGLANLGPQSLNDSADAYNLFRRTFQLAEHYIVYYQE